MRFQTQIKARDTKTLIGFKFCHYLMYFYPSSSCHCKLQKNRYDELKDLVIKLSHLAVNQDECEKIKNTAYAQLKGKKPKRELRYEDDEDDDFRLN